MEYSRYSNIASTLFKYETGARFLGETVNLVKPMRHSLRGPAMSILDRGRLISQLMRVSDEHPSMMIGPGKDRSSLIVMLGDVGFDSFVANGDVRVVREQLLGGHLNEQLFRARKQIFSSH